MNKVELVNIFIRVMFYYIIMLDIYRMDFNLVFIVFLGG